MYTFIKPPSTVFRDCMTIMMKSYLTLPIILMILKTFVYVDAVENGQIITENHVVMDVDWITKRVNEKDTTLLNSELKPIHEQKHFTLDRSAFVHQAQFQDYDALKTDTIPHSSDHPFTEIQTEDNFNIPEQIFSIISTQKVATSAVKDVSSNLNDKFLDILTQHQSTKVKQNVSFTSSTEFSDIPIQIVSNTPSYDKCSQYGGCELAGGRYWYCQCDDVCEEYNDCCLGYNLLTNKRSESNYSCVSIDSDSLFGVQSISSCPTTYSNESIIAKCSYGHIWDAGEPVLDYTNISRVYRNRYCALCHGVSAFSMKVIFTAIGRPADYINYIANVSDENLKRYLFKTCIYRILIPEDANVRYCIIGLVQNDDLLCNHYINPVYNLKEKIHYRNYLCSNTQNQLPHHCLYRAMRYMISNFERGNNFQLTRLSIIFSFKETNGMTAKPKCVEWNEEIDKDCDHLPKFINAQTDFDYSIRLPENATKTEMIQAALLTILVKSVEGFWEIGLNYQLKVDKKFTTITIKGRCEIIKTVFRHEITSIKHILSNQKINIKEKSSGRRFETVNQNYNQDTVNITGKMIIGPLRLTKQQYYSAYGITIPNVTFLELCHDIEIVVNRKDTETLEVVSLNCKSKLLQPKPNTLAILTVTFSSISSISLVVMIIKNRQHHFHLEVPISNLENLGISMVLSNILLIAGHLPTNINKWICYAISVISHYLWWAVFCFTSLAVLHIVKTLMQLKARRFVNKETKARRRRMMTLLGLTIPLAFVVPAILVDRFGPRYYSPGYGATDVCFPIKFPGNLIFFTGPVLGLIAINTISIVQIIVKIRIVTVATENLQRSSSFSEAKIFLRILSISGCLWITGVVAVFFDSEWIEYVFTTLCGLQGLIIAISNLTTERMSCYRVRKQSSTAKLN